MTSSSDIKDKLAELTFSDLTDLIAHATQLRDERRAEAMERLKQEAEVLGATVEENGVTKKKRRGRKPPKDEVEE